MPHPDCPTWLEINLDAVEENTRRLLTITQTQMMAVVKANAYGFGSVEISRAVLTGGAAALVVARFGEAEVLRSAGIDAPILVFGMLTPHEVDRAIDQNVILTLSSFEALDLFSSRARAMNRNVCVHLKVDTGMGRYGVLAEDVLQLVKRVKEVENVLIEGVYSHFAMVDSEADDPLTPLQLRRFEQALDVLRAEGINPRWTHCSNSAAALKLPAARFNMIRVGSAFLGIRPFYYLPFPKLLRRVLTWKASLASCRLLPAGWGISYGQEYIASGKEWIGVVPIGYGDGFRRVNNNAVLIDGRRVPVVGRVCVDLSMITLRKPYPIGSEIVIIGQQGKEEIQIEDLSDRWNTSQADVTTSINQRIPRFYYRDSEPV